MDIIGEEQIGFKPNYSTIDGIFVINSLLEILNVQKKSLFCAFIDLKKCFGSIWREGLWYKLNVFNFGSKMLNVLKSIYGFNVKSCVKMQCMDSNGTTSLKSSDMFKCENGLREGDILSPILFSLYVNDLKMFLVEQGCQGINVSNNNGNDVMYYLHM